AEDGIRDGHVTGVQTCALPISEASSARSTRAVNRAAAPTPSASPQMPDPAIVVTTAAGVTLRIAQPSETNRFPALSRTMPVMFRSEERRVGQEWKYRWTPEQYR